MPMSARLLLGRRNVRVLLPGHATVHARRKRIEVPEQSASTGSVQSPSPHANSVEVSSALMPCTLV